MEFIVSKSTLAGIDSADPAAIKNGFQKMEWSWDNQLARICIVWMFSMNEMY